MNHSCCSVSELQAVCSEHAAHDSFEIVFGHNVIDFIDYSPICMLLNLAINIPVRIKLSMIEYDISKI